MVYSTREDSDNIFGSHNIDKWSDLSNLEKDDEITARFTWANQEAYDQINARLYGCRYTVPFTGTLDPVIITLSARLTGVILYDNRKLIDSPEYDELAYHRKMVERVYMQIHGCQLSLITQTANAKTYPRAIASEEIITPEIIAVYDRYGYFYRG
jgi:phage gp36-like protein